MLQFFVKFLPIFLMLILINGLLVSYALANLQGEVALHITRIIKKSSETKVFTCSSERICGTKVIPGFYNQRSYFPIWTNNGVVLKQAHTLVKALLTAREEGLLPEIYHLAKIRSILDAISISKGRSEFPNPKIIAELDILLTDAFLLFASHLRAGRVNPETIHTAWLAYLPEIDLGAVLTSAIQSNQVAERLRALNPTHDGFKRLKDALFKYRQIARTGNWPQISSGPTLRLGDRNKRVVSLKTRLKITRDLIENISGDPEHYDSLLEAAVRRFQYRHGLKIDGIVGKNTIVEINQTVFQRIRQMELNLERWRWIPDDLGKRHILVNIANYHLSVVENDVSVLEMRVVVGRHYRRTPVFTETIKYLVLNPFWNVPFNIAVKDKLPLIKEDPDYLKKNHFSVFTGWEDNPKIVDPQSIDWNQISRSNFVYRFRQDPGPDNALGRIKFMFPNRFSVYLHDTPQRELFDETIRTFSSGCIRAEKPFELASYLLKDNSRWNPKRLKIAIENGKNRSIPLKNPVSIHVLYWTAWVDKGGTVHFRDDIYNRDLPLDQALREKLPNV